MRTVHTVAFIPVALLMLGACGDDSSSATNGTSVTAISTDAANATKTTLLMPDSTAADTAVAGDSSSDAPLSGPVQIDVVVGLDSGEDRIELVTVGSEITLNITNPNADDEFHVHGVEIEQTAKAGQMVTLNFTIDTAGTFEVESHITEDVLVTIEAT